MYSSFLHLIYKLWCWWYKIKCLVAVERWVTPSSVVVDAHFLLYLPFTLSHFLHVSPVPFSSIYPVPFSKCHLPHFLHLFALSHFLSPVTSPSFSIPYPLSSPPPSITPSLVLPSIISLLHLPWLHSLHRGHLMTSHSPMTSDESLTSGRLVPATRDPMTVAQVNSCVCVCVCVNGLGI